MTKKINDGGPAFPNFKIEKVQMINDVAVPIMEPVDGMSLRDYFAAKAMQSYVNSIRSESWFSDDMINKIAIESYKQADAMLKAKGGKDDTIDKS